MTSLLHDQVSVEETRQHSLDALRVLVQKYLIVEVAI